MLAAEPDRTEVAGVLAGDIEAECPPVQKEPHPGERPDRAAEAAVPDIEVSGIAAFDIAAPAFPVGLLAADVVVRPADFAPLVD